ncbi:uncharacterized protein LOC144124793 [Amblyomma americanum]
MQRKPPKRPAFNGDGSDLSGAAATVSPLPYPRPPVPSPAVWNCKCGSTSAKPGSLTCLGQRCPCFRARTSCTQCRCKGCRNPIRAPADDETIDVQVLVIQVHKV